MLTLQHITFAELRELVQSRRISPDTRLTLSIENDESAENEVRRQRSIEAMKKLRGSGNGRLVDTLLQERARDREQTP